MWEGEMKRGEGLKIREAKKEVNDKIPELGLVRGLCIGWLLN